MQKSYYSHHVFFCVNQRDGGGRCCQDNDAQRVRNYAKDKVKQLNMTGKGQVRVNNAGCLNRCSEGPVLVIYPEAVWYSYVNEDDVDEIIRKHLQQGRPVERLRLGDSSPVTR